ncbi:MULTISPECIES: EmmdR/YeeO family multidrug/toxin efflux MATE transporter [Pantoea]|jgi:putative MATE family efflux protein|uniref:Multidrug-efflux transporter n=1 Tax=Pantoea piersonii TaxID=2364647 RepID=A0AAJ5QND9_9GAMM|nr:MULTISPECIES: EmmdR/YeeO family multidrug/toxin efflux MATE transporter [Pantoea]MDU6433943.1 EmmdR/YeeO family multidrug/toxin efflux MATE transporter [Pantoea sp.]MBZ6388665.1 EmmdR/YeeO family multidrug/toxin efflux MATE transporter [Pantoea piersonii]MBZ6400512.1 EmmdR/YeeO family multidrug/toxin efflux MATE transporter [Pantoea piersonii]MBZ6408991.1 EmmdR/YeeO family multidrug/toxin efflux MATE transporter [Pantoea piersonii]MBZ6429261.1 EmmdR/YeeO family multidrug/toxin efflux MATE t
MQAIKRTAWYPKRRFYRTLFWREITPLAVPIFIENLCVMLMGVLSTFLVSWLGKEAMAGVGLADSFNIIIISFFAAIDLGTTVVVAFSLAKRNGKRARAATRQSLALMTVLSLVLVFAIELWGHLIIDLIAGGAEPKVKELALSYLQTSAWSYPAAAIALIGSGALRGAGNTKIPMLINGGMNILNIVISSVLIYGAFSWEGLGFVGAGLGLTISRYIGAIGVIYVLMIGFNASLKISLPSYFRRWDFKILMEVLGIGVPASIESVLFNGGKLLTQVFVAGMGTDAIAGNFIAFSIASLINLPGNALGSASTIITGTRLGRNQVYQAERQIRHVFWLASLCLCALAFLTVPLSGLLARFYTRDPDVISVTQHLIWLNAAFMPIWAASWVLPAGLKGARDARYTMYVSMFSMWGARVVVGYVLGIMLGMGVVGVWLGMFLDWAVRGACFWWRLKSGKWLDNYRKMVAKQQ